jgi:hypothetical protein
MRRHGDQRHGANVLHNRVAPLDSIRRRVFTQDLQGNTVELMARPRAPATL